MNKRPPTLGRKLTRRPLETPGLESTKANQLNYNQPYSEETITTSNVQHDQYSFQSTYQQPINPNAQHIPDPYSGNNPLQTDYARTIQTSGPYGLPPAGFSMPIQPEFLSNPVLTNAAMQYGQALMGSGTKIVNKEIEKYVPVSRLKYYFAVDTSYVRRKLSILFFPYLHADWSIKYSQSEEPVQPRYEVNAPDLYIPSMAFLTYILIAGLILGTSDKFTPEKLGMQASSALAWSTLEIIIQIVTLYVTNINTNLKTFDLLSYSSYKYVGIIIAMLSKLFFGQMGYIVALVYICVSLAFFVMRTLQLQVFSEPIQSQSDMYGMPQPPSMYNQTGIKRRRYFILFVALSQPFLIWWLSSNVF